MKLNLILILIVSLFLINCSKHNDDVICYIVKSGTHYSYPRNYQKQNNSIIFNFTVNNTWKWQSDLSLSKVLGLRFGSATSNSVRLAVRSTKNGSQLYMMCHVDEKLIIIEIEHVFNGIYTCSLGYADNYFWLVFNNKNFAVHGVSTDLKDPKLSLPYIGGDYTIDHDWIVPINILN